MFTTVGSNQYSINAIVKPTDIVSCTRFDNGNELLISPLLGHYESLTGMKWWNGILEYLSNIKILPLFSEEVTHASSIHT